jgi:hypothetical protein
MTDFDRNTRTLIVCFILAIIVLVPLIIVESNQNMESRSKVLGEIKEVNRIVLPDVGGLKY